MKKRFILLPLLFITAIIALMKLIWDSLADDTTEKTQPYDTLRKRVDKVLKQRCDNKLFTADALLAELGESRDIVESSLNQSVEMAIEQYRIQIAERLLRSTDDTISCIAETAGFGDSSSLYKPFTIKYGCSPSQYREIFRAG